MEKKYKPTDSISKVEMNRKKAKISMEEDDDPATVFNQINDLMNDYGVKFELEDYIVIFMEVLPLMYI